MSEPDLKVEVRGLFATPVAVTLLPGAEALNAELAPLILERERREPGTQHSNLGGWQSSWDLEAWGGAAVERVLAAARGLAGRLTASRRGEPVEVDWRVNCWANVNRRGHGNEFHTHPGSFWSGVYYLAEGGAPSAGGELELQDPRGVAPVMYAPMLTFAGPSGPSLGASELIRPRAGMMVLFPSWLQHAVRPHQGPDPRISISFNLSLP